MPSYCIEFWHRCVNHEMLCALAHIGLWFGVIVCVTGLNEMTPFLLFTYDNTVHDVIMISIVLYAKPYFTCLFIYFSLLRVRLIGCQEIYCVNKRSVFVICWLYILSFDESWQKMNIAWVLYADVKSSAVITLALGEMSTRSGDCEIISGQTSLCGVWVLRCVSHGYPV